MKFTITLDLDEREARDLCAATREMYGPVMASVHGKLTSAIASAERLTEMLEFVSADEHGEPHVIRYRSCDIMLELWVRWQHRRHRGREIEMVAAQLPPDLVPGHRHEMAVVHVTPFVEAVKHGDPKAIAELRRALLEQKRRGLLLSQGGVTPTNIPECQYDPGAAG